MLVCKFITCFISYLELYVFHRTRPDLGSYGNEIFGLVCDCPLRWGERGLESRDTTEFLHHPQNGELICSKQSCSMQRKLQGCTLHTHRSRESYVFLLSKAACVSSGTSAVSRCGDDFGWKIRARDNTDFSNFGHKVRGACYRFSARIC